MVTLAEPIDADTLRARHEFLARPDLQLTADAVAAMLDLPLRHAIIILESLVQDGFLRRAADGGYVHRSRVSHARSH
jgi:DNA-binding IclR family transcriptional regulator